MNSQHNASDDLKRLFQDSGTQRKLSADEVLYLAGSKPQEVFCVEKGRIAVYQGSTNASRQPIGKKTAGALVGEVAALDGQPRAVTARAIEATSVLVLDRETFVDKLRSEPGLALQIARNLASLVRNSIG